jgi:PAS domain S-box-containing protein
LDAVHATQVIDYFAPDDRTKIINEVLPAVRTGGFWEGELDFRNFETGQIIPVLYNIFPVRDASGAVAAYGTVTRDLTESKLADQQLRYVASIVQSSDDAIVSKDLDGIITSWNRGAERVFGYAAKEVVGKSITIVIPEDRLNEEAEILRRIRKGDRIDHFETVRQRKDGSQIAVSLTISPVKNAEGKVIGASKIARDITEQKRSQEQIATLAKEAEHRSKNLLQTVQAVVRLSTSPSPEALKEAIEGRLHALSNVHSLFVATRWVGAELSTIANQELAPYAGRGQMRVRVHGPSVLLNPDLAQAVAMVLHELAINAAKYGALSNGGGHIDLSWEHPQNGSLKLRWAENEGPTVHEPSRRGFGSRVIEQLVRTLKGNVNFEWRPEGLICEISFPWRYPSQTGGC